MILVGGIRSTGQMMRILRAWDVDFLAAARPFIREPDFPQSLKAGRQGLLDCVSCNICLEQIMRILASQALTNQRRLLVSFVLTI